MHGGGHVCGGMHGRGCAWQGMCMAEGVHGMGHGRGMHGRGVCGGGACVAGGHAWQGHVWWGGVLGRRDGHCSERYASYWNALLLWKFLYICLLNNWWKFEDMTRCLFKMSHLKFH